tara:strand:- start:50798 stop:53281 length:2484 start_codon:yes stop_codon:yes gene_type:complete
MISKQFIWRTLQREIKTIELKIVMIILCLTTMFLLIMTLGLQNVSSQLQNNTQSLLGGQLILESPSPIPEHIIEQAEARKLTYTQNIGFFTMASTQEKFSLVQIESFDPIFPLVGELEIYKNKQKVKVESLPEEGEIWASASFLNKFNASLGEVIQIADYPFKLSAELVTFPFMLSNTSAFSPIVYMHKKDVTKLDVIHPGSRVNYRLILKGENKNIQDFLKSGNVKKGQFKIVTQETGRQAIAKPFQTVERYLSVIIIIQSLLASIVIAVSVYEYAKRQRHVVAILRTLGASPQAVLSSYIITLMSLSVLIIMISVILGYCLLNGLFYIWQPFGITTAQWYGSSFYFTVSLALLIALCFSLPAILSLKKVPIQSMLRSSQAFESHYKIIYLIAFILIIGLVCLYTQDFVTPIRLLALFSIMTALGLGVSMLIFFGLQGVRRIGPHVFRFAVNTLLKHRWQGIMQCTMYTLIFTLLLLSAIIQWDILSAWRAQLPEDTPNYFLVNVQANELSTLNQWFDENQLLGITSYPVVRAHYSHVNGKPVSTWGAGQRDPTAKRGLRRPINLTWMSILPENNESVGGVDWSTVQPGDFAISIEAEFAKKRDVSLGDVLTFQIQDKAINGKIVHLRTLSWQSFTPNFFIIFPPDVLNTFPHTFMSSFYLPAVDGHKIGALHQRFPQISIIDLDAILQQLSSWIFKIANIFEIILSIILMSGVLLMAIMMKATLKERIHESALLKCLGASARFLKSMIVIEYAILGAVSGLASGLFAQIIIHDIAYDYFKINYQIGWKWILIGFLVSTFLLVSLGLLGFRRVIKTPSTQVLRGTI